MISPVNYLSYLSYSISWLKMKKNWDSHPLYSHISCSHVEHPMQNGRWTCQNVANTIQNGRWTCPHVGNPMQNGRWTCQNVANTIQNGRWTCPHVVNPMQNGRWTCPNVANTMQNDKFKFQTVANTRQMVPAKKSKKKSQTCSKKNPKTISHPIYIYTYYHIFMCIYTYPSPLWKLHVTRVIWRGAMPSAEILQQMRSLEGAAAPGGFFFLMFWYLWPRKFLSGVKGKTTFWRLRGWETAGRLQLRMRGTVFGAKKGRGRPYQKIAQGWMDRWLIKDVQRERHVEACTGTWFRTHGAVVWDKGIKSPRSRSHDLVNRNLIGHGGHFQPKTEENNFLCGVSWVGPVALLDVWGSKVRKVAMEETQDCQGSM